MKTLSRPAAFWSIAAILALYLSASAAPTPLYVVYQAEWGFSSITLTLVFAVYVFALLVALLVLGRLSDHVGRRPMIAVSIALEALAMVTFGLAGGVLTLGAARVVQGVATGIAMTAMGAALVDLDPPQSPGLAGVVSGLAPVGGLAVGALIAGALVEYGPLPTHLVYLLILAGLAAAAVAVARMPESSQPRPGALSSLRPRLGVPARLRGQMLALVPITVASWALGGLYLSLGPSVSAQVFAMPNHLVGGVVVALLFGTGAVTIYMLRGWQLGRALDLAAGVLAAGMAVSLAGLLVESPALAGLGAVVAGIGFGASARGTFGTVAAIALPEERGGLFAVFYVVSYLAFSIPALAAGLAISSAGLRSTAIVYGCGVLALSVLAAWAQRRLDAPGACSDAIAGAGPGGRRRRVDTIRTMTEPGEDLNSQQSPEGRPGSKLSRFLPLIVIVAALAVVTVLFVSQHSSQALPGNAKSHAIAGFDGEVLSPRRPAPSLGGLHNYLGEPVSLASYRGKAVFVTFLYTHCPDVCPLITAELHNTLELLGPAKSRNVRIVAISVDPHGDTRRTVSEFLKEHKMTGRMKYLIGSAKQLGPVWEAWNVGSQRDSVNPEFVAHTALIYGIGASGKLTTIYPANFKPSQIAHDIPKLLAD